MPFLNIDGLRVYYRLEGGDHQPVLILSHSLGQDHGQWDPQIPDLARHFRVLRYDIRGHGATDVPTGDASIERLGWDVLAIADSLGIDTFAFCGLSIGGMIGQWLAGSAPERLTHAVLANTSPHFPDPSLMEARRRKVLEAGMPAIRDMVMQRFFTPESLAARPPHVVSSERVLLATDPKGYAACAAAVRDLDTRSLLPGIKTPALIISGDHDVSTPWAGHGDAIAAAIPHARVVHLPAAHLSNLERPRSFAAALLEFLLPAPEGDRLEAGLAMRRSIAGAEYVDRAMGDATGFTRDFQEMITRYAWGTVWLRPGLDPRTRRMLALTVLGSLGRWDEFRWHMRLGLERELEPCDLKETLMQLSVYAGVPAANTGFRIASEELKTEKSPL
jgi:3-oxoadipate enol-lactonase/4-carboxymuconolactone decarboxylase